MKKLLLIFALAGTVSAQEYLLPIGKNVDRRETVVSIWLKSYEVSALDTFAYKPEMGVLQEVIESRLLKLANSFFPPVPEAYLNITFSKGPWFYESQEFSMQKSGDHWVIPPKVLEVKLKYGTAIAWWVPGVTASTMQVVDALGTRTFSSADGSGYDDSPCFLGASRAGFQNGAAGVQVEYALPEFQKERGITAGSVTLWQNERYVSFDLLDGHFLGASASPPDFLEFLRAPEMPQRSPKISRIARVGHTTELTVSAVSNISAHLEFAEQLGGSWYSIPKYLQPLSLQTGSSKFTHTTDAPASFYRLRVSSSSPQ